ncbi:PAS-domain containing protein [Sphingomonas hankookensis]|uniref:PAS-domain containing protein n=1 Tax=Sphingomonas hankookensis TaxID=563996 RepID=UPI00234E5D0F|nr:PAS-domain containing protein [Sphingomonas hankookensis]WCP71942.1 PAS-domain containing protein [Sphingomonas hankookensis]
MAAPELLALVMNHMRHGMLVYDAAERIVPMNAHVGRMLGFAGSAIGPGASLPEYLAHVGAAVGWSPDRVAGVVENHRAWRRAGEVRHFDHHFDDGTILEICFTPVDQGGAILTYVDVTHTRHLTKVSERRENLTREAGTLLHRVADIAAQKRVVAFNARIEAARIGEGGRAFAVVADEIRHLSRQTSDVLHHINHVIDESLRLM